MSVPEFFKAAEAGNVARLEALRYWVNSWHKGATPLHAAAIHGRVEAVRWLIEHDALVNARDDEFHMTPLQWANEKGHPEVIRLLLTRSLWLDAWDAVAIGHVEHLSALIDREPELLTAEQDWGTLVHHACIWAQIWPLDWLLARGVDYQKRSRHGFTPLEIARRQAADGRTHTPIVTDRRKAEIERESGRIITLFHDFAPPDTLG